eukprot:Gregarina_sp_Poly_1__2287@NODE_1608_length_3719_cov_22_234940_g1060_i0_p2_GENE_NODE_1608_length_3719_cov_22_234940_g1060_i0NODE_1608_length_3719_cov_22_234940_g1060_i0_p2_ORF_typecomplete_len214_score19_85tRNA_bind_2/PF13725_6/0_0026_NODE_1608_length_3719_cov_22_234940_g1060_i030763633
MDNEFIISGRQIRDRSNSGDLWLRKFAFNFGLLLIRSVLNYSLPVSTLHRILTFALQARPAARPRDFSILLDANESLKRLSQIETAADPGTLESCRDVFYYFASLYFKYQFQLRRPVTVLEEYFLILFGLQLKSIPQIERELCQIRIDQKIPISLPKLASETLDVVTMGLLKIVEEGSQKEMATK